MNLPPSVWESLYQEDIYQIQGKVLVVIPTHWEALSAENVVLLSKILGSVKLKIESVQIISKPNVDLDSLKAYSATKILSFGSPVRPVLQPYENTSLEGASVIYADSLNELDDPKKRNLWLALRQMFNL